MKKSILLGLFSAIFACSLAPHALAASEFEKSIAIDNLGKVSIRGAKVQQVIGNSFFTRVNWDDISLKVLVRTDDKTRVTKHFTGESRPSDIAEGQYLNIEGRLNTSSDNFDIIASKIQNLSLDTDSAEFAGTIVATNPESPSFTLKIKTGEIITVRTSTTTTITKGALKITPALIRSKDTVLSVKGTYDFPAKIMQADSLVIFQDQKVFKPRAFDAIFLSAGSTTVRALIEGKEYTLPVRSNTKIMNKRRGTTSLSRFIANDPLKIYGSIREALDPIIDAESIRNINL